MRIIFSVMQILHAKKAIELFEIVFSQVDDRNTRRFLGNYLK